MASDLLFSIDTRALRRSLAKGLRDLKVTEKETIEAANEAWVKYAESTLEEAQERAPVGTGGGGKLKSAPPGDLRASGDVDGPHDIGNGIEVFIGFRKVYARIQDLGGTIVPVRAKRLFNPLREGVQPLKKGDPRRKDQKQGFDFALAKSVTLPGSRYLTGLMPERAANAAPAVGMATVAILRRRLASKGLRRRSGRGLR